MATFRRPPARRSSGPFERFDRLGIRRGCTAIDRVEELAGSVPPGVAAGREPKTSSSRSSPASWLLAILKVV
jgi:hypothetical protein